MDFNVNVLDVDLKKKEVSFDNRLKRSKLEVSFDGRV